MATAEKRKNAPLRFFFVITMVFIFFIGTLVIAVFLKRPTVPEFFVNEQSEMIIQAKRKAAATMDTLHVLYEKYPEKTFVRFSFEVTSGHVEHLWGKVLQLDSARVKLKLLRGGTAQDMYYPETLTLPVARVEDWLVELPDGKIRGGFTAQAILIMETQQRTENADSLEKELQRYADEL